MRIKRNFRRYEDASLEYTGVNRHASATRIGLMDSTVLIEVFWIMTKKKDKLL